MSAWHKGDGSEHDYVMRVLAAIIQQAGGEIRVKGELIDRADPTLIWKKVDLAKQELVLELGTAFSETFVVSPAKSGDFVAAAPAASRSPETRAKSSIGGAGSWDNPRLNELEKEQMKNRLKARVAEELRQYHEQQRGS
jgi:hypothetical protein